MPLRDRLVDMSANHGTGTLWGEHTEFVRDESDHAARPLCGRVSCLRPWQCIPLGTCFLQENRNEVNQEDQTRGDGGCPRCPL